MWISGTDHQKAAWFESDFVWDNTEKDITAEILLTNLFNERIDKIWVIEMNPQSVFILLVI